MSFDMENSFWESNICKFCLSKHNSESSKKSHENAQSHLLKVEVGKFLNDNTFPWQYDSLSKSSTTDLIQESPIPIIGLESIHEFCIEDQFYFWVCSSCFIASQELLDVSEHLRSRSHRLTYIHRFHPTCEPNSNLPPKDFAVKLNQVTAKIGALDRGSSPKVCLLKCNPMEAAAKVGIEIDDDEEMSNHDEEMTHHDDEMTHRDEETDREITPCRSTEEIKDLLNQLLNLVADEPMSDDELTFTDGEMSNHDEAVANCDEGWTSIHMEEGEISQAVEGDVKELLDDLVDFVVCGYQRPCHQRFHSNELDTNSGELIDNFLSENIVHKGLAAARLWYCHSCELSINGGPKNVTEHIKARLHQNKIKGIKDTCSLFKNSLIPPPNVAKSYCKICRENHPFGQHKQNLFDCVKDTLQNKARIKQRKARQKEAELLKTSNEESFIVIDEINDVDDEPIVVEDTSAVDDKPIVVVDISDDVEEIVEPDNHHARLNSRQKESSNNTTRQKERSTSRQKERSTGRQKERSTSRQKERATSRQKEKSTSSQIERFTSRHRHREISKRSSSRQNERSTSSQKERSTTNRHKQKEMPNSREKGRSKNRKKERSPIRLKKASSKVIGNSTSPNSDRKNPFSEAEIITHLIQQQCFITKNDDGNGDILRKRVKLFSEIVGSEHECNRPLPKVLTFCNAPFVGIEYINEMTINRVKGDGYVCIFSCFLCKICGWIRQSRKLMEHLCSFQHRFRAVNVYKPNWANEIKQKLLEKRYSDVDDLLLSYTKELQIEHGRPKFMAKLTFVLIVSKETKTVIPSAWFKDQTQFSSFQTLEEPSKACLATISSIDEKLLAEVKVLLKEVQDSPPISDSLVKISKPILSPVPARTPSQKCSSSGFACIPKIGTMTPSSITVWDHQTEEFMTKISAPMPSSNKPEKMYHGKRKITSAEYHVQAKISKPMLTLGKSSDKISFQKESSSTELACVPKICSAIASRKVWDHRMDSKRKTTSAATVAPSQTLKITSPTVKQDRQIITPTRKTISKEDNNLQHRKPFSLDLTHKPCSTSVSKPCKPFRPQCPEPIKSTIIEIELIEAAKIETVKTISFPRQMPTSPSPPRHSSQPPEPYEVQSASFSPPLDGQVIDQEIKKSSNHPTQQKAVGRMDAGTRTSSEKKGTTELLRAYYDDKEKDNSSLEDKLLKILLEEREKQHKREEQQHELFSLVAQSLVSEEEDAAAPAVQSSSTDASVNLSSFTTHLQSEETITNANLATMCSSARAYSADHTGPLSTSFPTAENTRPGFPPSPLFPRPTATDTIEDNNVKDTSLSMNAIASLLRTHLLPEDWAKIQENLNL